MKILMVSNLYPPYYLGGYEIRCAQVAEALHGAGYDVKVLTSVHGLPLTRLSCIEPRSEQLNGVPVYRWLHQYYYGPQPRPSRPWTFFQAKRELQDARKLLTLLASFRPDIVNWWNMNGLSKTLLPIPNLWGVPDIHWIEDWWVIEEYGSAGEKASAFWISLWDGNWGPRVYRPLLRVIGRKWEQRIKREGIPTRNFPNCPRHVCFVSEYMRTLHREAGLEFPSSEVIYGGVPIAHFYEPIHGPKNGLEPLRILYAGQISPDRGLHTVLEAIGHMSPTTRARLTLSVAGHNSSNYFTHIKARMNALDFTACVSLLGKIPHDQMPRIYKEHDILVFPSTRPEGLPLTMIEAMLAGCAVLTTGSGGAMEIAVAANLPIFPEGDYLALSRLLAQLIINRGEVYQIASRGQSVAVREFGLDRMMDRFEATLQRVHKPKEEV